MIPADAARAVRPGPRHDARSGPVSSLVPGLRTGLVAALAPMLTACSGGASLSSDDGAGGAAGAGGWIDAQMALPASLVSPYTRANSNGSNPQARHEAWWNNALYGEDQLRQRVAFAPSQLFVVSDVDFALANAQYGVADYYDMLAAGAFGNYRELLEDVALHPVMGVYLSMVLNERADEARRGGEAECIRSVRRCRRPAPRSYRRRRR